uniref:RRM domain-containing protein n=1 Tax=Oryza glumipatula TaxID=40148 RepID=A0A0D9YQ81_9ORYZ
MAAPSYLLELRGELLLASVLQRGDDDDRLSVSVHAFDVDAAVHALDPDAAVDDDAEAVPVWEKRDDVLGDHVLFLGYPGSFAVEAARFGGDLPGGSAYFVVRSEQCRVYRYSFVDGGGGTATTTTLVETLPAGWNDERCMWFLPEPNIDWIKVEEEAAAAAPASRRRCRQDLRIYAGDLSPQVDSLRLREMYSEHEKVAQARVAYDKRGRSRGFGFMTMATQEGFCRALGRCNAVEKPATLYICLNDDSILKISLQPINHYTPLIGRD